MTEQAASSDALTATRRSLHQVAEHVLSAARKRATGQIALVPGEGGVRTPRLPDGRVIALIDGDIAVIDDTGVRRAPLTTPSAAAEFVGTEPGFPWTKHPPGTESMPDAPLVVDPDAARVLAGWFALGDAALRELAARLTPAAEPVPQIFPEHFDLAITVAEVNYGVSPGDDAIPAPTSTLARSPDHRRATRSSGTPPSAPTQPSPTWTRCRPPWLSSSREINYSAKPLCAGARARIRDRRRCAAVRQCANPSLTVEVT